MDQSLNAALRSLFAGSGPVAAWIMAKTGMAQSDYVVLMEVVVAMGTPAVAAAIAYYRIKKASQIKRGSDMPEVTKVVVKSSANGEIGALRDNEDATKVVPDYPKE